MWKLFPLIISFCTIAEYAPGQSVPPPVEQISADCRSAVYATDQLVCADATLRALDAEMRGLWTRAALAGQVFGTDYRVQNDWFRQRSLCAFEADHRRCALTAYSRRIAELREKFARP